MWQLSPVVESGHSPPSPLLAPSLSSDRSFNNDYGLSMARPREFELLPMLEAMHDETGGVGKVITAPSDAPRTFRRGVMRPATEGGRGLWQRI